MLKLDFIRRSLVKSEKIGYKIRRIIYCAKTEAMESCFVIIITVVNPRAQEPGPLSVHHPS